MSLKMGKKQLKLSIPTPCSEDWNAMTADKNGRFCASCQKNVIDFSTMTDKQIIDYFTHFQGETCGRLTEKQLNAVISEPLSPTYSNRWAWALSALLLPTVAASQTAKTIEQSEIVTPSVFEAKSAEKGLPIEGKIMELGSDLPLTSGSVYLVIDTNGNKHVIDTKVDKEGSFKVYLPQTHENQPFTLLFAIRNMKVEKLIFNNYADVANSQLFVSMERKEKRPLIKLRGTVVDSLNQPLPFATIALKENSIIKTGTQSDFDGLFNLEFAPQDADNQAIELEVSLVGMYTNTIKISLADANQVVDIKLKEIPLPPVCVNYKIPLIISESGVALTERQLQQLPTRDEALRFAAISGGISRQVITPRNFFQRIAYRLKNLFRKKSRD
jgi:hypothetical protein